MAQAVSRQPVTAESRFAPGPVHVRFVADEVAEGQDFLRVTRLSSVSIIPLELNTCISSGWWTIGPFEAIATAHQHEEQQFPLYSSMCWLFSQALEHLPASKRRYSSLLAMHNYGWTGRLSWNFTFMYLMLLGIMEFRSRSNSNFIYMYLDFSVDGPSHWGVIFRYNISILQLLRENL
jgi:hypothetical protein